MRERKTLSLECYNNFASRKRLNIGNPRDESFHLCNPAPCPANPRHPRAGNPAHGILTFIFIVYSMPMY